MTVDWFADDMEALKAVYNQPAGFVTTATIVKRQRVERAIAEGAVPPILGIVATRCVTQAKQQPDIRDSQVVIEWDYYAESSDPVLVAKQAEIACEAILLVVDRLAGSGLRVYEAGGLPGSVTVDLTEGVEEGEHPIYWRRASVTAPLWDRDVVI